MPQGHACDQPHEHGSMTMTMSPTCNMGQNYFDLIKNTTYYNTSYPFTRPPTFHPFPSDHHSRALMSQRYSHIRGLGAAPAASKTGSVLFAARPLKPCTAHTKAYGSGSESEAEAAPSAAQGGRRRRLAASKGGYEAIGCVPKGVGDPNEGLCHEVLTFKHGSAGVPLCPRWFCSDLRNADNGA